MKSLTKSSEDYLEAILILEEQNKKIKSVDIASMLNVSRPAVNKATNELRENGYITKEDYSSIVLTDEGRQAASHIYEKHRLIKSFLQKLGVSEENSEIDCCKIEHIISEETFKAVKEFVNKK